jgi:hypothetical protein
MAVELLRLMDFYSFEPAEIRGARRYLVKHRMLLSEQNFEVWWVLVALIASIKI